MGSNETITTYYSSPQLADVLDGVTLHKYGPTVNRPFRSHRPLKLQTHQGTKVLDGVTLHNYGGTVDQPFRSHQMQHVTPIDNNSDLEPTSPAGALTEDDAAESGAEAETEAAVEAERKGDWQKEVGTAAEEAAAGAAAGAAAARPVVGDAAGAAAAEADPRQPGSEVEAVQRGPIRASGKIGPKQAK